MRKHILALCLLAAVVALAGCSPRNRVPAASAPADIVLGVAGFTQPRYTWELMAGYLPEPRTLVEDKVLFDLDRLLFEQLDKTTGRRILGPAVTRQCQEIVVFEEKDSRQAALDYWVRVGKCLPADYLLVPQLVDWREREGQPMGVTSPAGLVMDLFVVDVKNHGLVSRFHFDETQTSLSENLLDAGKFFSRGGKWITARELAKEGMAQGVAELGL